MTTEIDWGDGSNDKIRLTYDAPDGNRIVAVSSDANTRSSSRSKSINFKTGSIIRTLVVNQDAAEPTPNRACLTFKSTGTNTISLSCNGTAAPVLYYSTDGINWTLWDYSALAISVGHPVFIYGNNTGGFSTSDANYSTFVIGGTDNVTCSGSVTTLIDGTDNLNTIPHTYCFYKLFTGCTKLVSPPSFPSMTLKNYCYAQAFYGCTGLLTCPALPATTLTQRCYNQMFRGCSNITTAPVLSALTLVNQCYHYMFYGCGKLNYVKALFTTTPSTSYTSNWLNRVASTGTFVKNANASWTNTGVSAVPAAWTIVQE